jgi:hypothetical protein
MDLFNDLVLKLKENTIAIKSLEKDRKSIIKKMIAASDLKIGDEVRRNRGFNYDKTDIFFISSISFDNEYLILKYGIKRNMSDSIDTYSGIPATELKRPD